VRLSLFPTVSSDWCDFQGQLPTSFADQLYA
jgi:hypothetical protein